LHLSALQAARQVGLATQRMSVPSRHVHFTLMVSS
jgi:hypothetical protein